MGIVHLFFYTYPSILFLFEYMVHTWIPEMEKRISINFEDNHIVTNNGVEWLYPSNEKIIAAGAGAIFFCA